MNRVTVYVAGPYTKPDPVSNTATATAVADRLFRAGYLPFLPHAMTMLWHFAHHHAYDEWLGYTMAWCERCDCLLRLHGESNGSDREVERMLELGRPVFHTFDDLLAGLPPTGIANGVPIEADLQAAAERTSDD